MYKCTIRFENASFKSGKNEIEMGRYSSLIDAIKTLSNNWHRIGRGNYLIQLMSQNYSDSENWQKHQKHSRKVWFN